MAEITGGTLPTVEVQAVSASSEYSSSYLATEAFNGVEHSRETDRWVSDGGYDEETGLPVSGNGEWFQFDFVGSEKIEKIKLFPGNINYAAPKKLSFYVSTTGLFSGEEIYCGYFELPSEPLDNMWSGWYVNPEPNDKPYLRVVINSLWGGSVNTIIPEWMLSSIGEAPKKIIRTNFYNPFPVLGGV